MLNTELPDQFLYSREGPWPQPSPSHPLICADEVLNIPPIETLLFNETIGARYLQSQLAYPPLAAQYAADVRDWKGVSPERLDTIMLKTLFTRFKVRILPSEMTQCKEAFKDDPAILQELELGTWFKYDFTAMDLIDPLDGTFCAATKLFIRSGAEGVSSVRIIAVNGLPIYRTDSSFGIASLYALQGASYHVLFVVHPALHFPMDSVNAITKTSVPMGHPLFQLFLPHSAYSLALDNAVLESADSVVNNNAQGTRFDPLTANAYNLKLLFGAGYSGLGPEDGQQYDPVAYPRFDYMRPRFFNKDTDPLFDSEYGRWLGAYFEGAFLPFCTKVADTIHDSSQLMLYVERWARYCSAHVSGFPTATEIQDRNKLAMAMAIYIWNNSVSHGGDHWSFANEISAVEKCLRIRRKPPVSRKEATVDNQVERIFAPNDMQRAELCQYMFFQAWAIEPTLADTLYAFTEPELLDATRNFRASLNEINKLFCHSAPPPTQPGMPDPVTTCQSLVAEEESTGSTSRSVPLARTIPASIQY